MNVILKYIETPEFKIREAAVIASFNGYEAANGRMVKRGNEWRFECILPAGEYHYRFLINHELLLNDPWNNLFELEEENELWSVLYINQQGLQLCNPGGYQPAIECCDLLEPVSFGENYKKNYFDITKVEQITAFLHFKKLYGLHTVTAAWYLPDGSLFASAEQMVYASLLRVTSGITFSLEGKEILRRGFEGKWKLIVFFDGAFSLEKDFFVCRESTRSFYCDDQKIHS